MKPVPSRMTCQEMNRIMTELFPRNDSTETSEPLPDTVEDAFVDHLESCPPCFQSFAELLLNQPDARMLLLMTQASPN